MKGFFLKSGVFGREELDWMVSSGKRGVEERGLYGEDGKEWGFWWVWEK